MNLLDSNNQPAPSSVETSLQSAIDAFKTAPVTGVATNLLKTNMAQSLAEEQANAPTVDSEVEQAVAHAEESEQEETTTEPEEPSSAFGEQFESTFGMKPDEAVALVNELASFRDEMNLMRSWGVNATEYDSRIAAVREFYNTLPEDSREQFNTPEGAKAIYSHLESTGKVASPNTSKRNRANTSVRQGAKAPAVEFIKRSEILAMNDQQAKANYARISKAYQEGRVIENQ